MPTIQESLDDLVANTTTLTNTVSGRITDMDGKISSANTAKVAAEAAKAGAEVAKGLADTAKTDAETAQTLANNAKVAAETAQGIAATAKTDALSAKAATDTAKGNAIAAQAASENAKNSAQDWATKTSGAVDGGEYSAKYHATAASTSASDAATTLSGRYTKAETDAKIVALSPKEVLTGASNPAVSVAGVLFYNTTTDVLNVSDGSNWSPVYEPPGTSTNPFSSLDSVTTEGYTYVMYKGSTVYGYVKSGWLLAMRVSNNGTFGWSSAYWENSTGLNATSAPGAAINIKNGDVWTASGVTSIRVSGSTSSSSIMDNNLDFTFNTSNSLQQMFASGLNSFSGNVSAGRTAWLNWFTATTGTASNVFDNQPHCNSEAINSGYSSNGARIGITMNNENSCSSNDSGLGLGVWRSANPGAGGERWNPTTAYYGYGALWVK